MEFLNNIFKRKTRAEPTPTTQWFLTEGEKSLCAKGYTKLIDNPEVRMGIERIADLISTMTIYLMENSDNGDIRVKNELSKKVDIHPYRYMTRQLWISWIIREVLIHGNAIVYPKTTGGYLEDLIPVDHSKVNYFDDGKGGYYLTINGKKYNHDEVLHFRINPQLEKPWRGESYKTTIKDVVQNLKQASKTNNEFMSNKILPSLIVKVDALTDEVASAEGRNKVYDNFVRASEAGEPWIVPSGLIDVVQVKPLTLNDIALKDTIELDKKTVAGILGIPAFLLGIGQYSESEYNNFIKTRIMTIAKAIEQELTLKLLYSPDMYFKFNMRSLFSYGINDLNSVYTNLYKSGIVTGNEVRDVFDLSPKEGLDELIILENFIPKDKIGDQKKLGGEEDEQAIQGI